MRDLRSFWGVRRLAEDRVGLVRLGHLRCWLARAEREWAIGQEAVSDGVAADIAQVPFDVVPADLVWRRTAFAQAPRDFQLVPIVPDRPLVIRTVEEVHLPGRESLTLHATFPLTLEVRVLAGDRTFGLGILDPVPLSDTWIGTPKEGQLGYSIPEPAQVEADSLPLRQDWAAVSVTLQNDSRETLPIGTFALRPMEVQLFSGTDRIYGGTVHIQYDASGREAVRYGDGVFPEGAAVVPLASAHRQESGLGRRLLGMAWRMTERSAGR